jgi:hypothetical protein
VQRFTFLFSAPTFEAEDLEGLRVAEIIAAIQRMGFQVIRARRIEDAEIAVQTDAASAAWWSIGARRVSRARPLRCGDEAIQTRECRAWIASLRSQ